MTASLGLPSLIMCGPLRPPAPWPSRDHAGQRARHQTPSRVDDDEQGEAAMVRKCTRLRASYPPMRLASDCN